MSEAERWSAGRARSLPAEIRAAIARALDGPPGIRSRTTVLVVAVVAAVWLSAALLTWRSAQMEAAELFDGHLAQAASMLIAQSSMAFEEPEEIDDRAHAPLTHRYARKVAFQVWEGGRRLTVHSEHAPNTRLSPADEGFSDTRVDGVHWRVFSGWNGDRSMLIQVGERSDTRDAMAEELAEGMLGPLIWALPLLAVLLWVVIGRAVRPLHVLAREIAARSPDRLEALQGVPVPREVAPLVRRLDHLFARVEEALRAEKRFTGDAAHELRTPIAALSAQAEVALAATDDGERRRALQAVLSAARRMARLVEQLLTLARADSLTRSEWPDVNLAELLREVVADRAEQGLEQQVELAVEAPDAVAVPGEADWLRILLRNLVDNALRHAPPGSVVQLELADRPAAAELCVSDAGPGVAEGDLAMLGERFWRAAVSGGGSGLGLSIVRRIAELHGTAPVFSSGPGGRGLVVRISFRRGPA